jgi:hypothetical protein
MINLLRLTNDIFDDKALSDLNLRSFSDNHLIRLANNNPGGVYSPMIASTTVAYTAYFGNMTNEAVKEAISEGLTVDMNIAREAVINKISKQQALVIFLFGDGIGIYQQFFPHGMDEYHQSKLDNLTTILERYQTAANAHLFTTYPTEVSDVTALITAYRNARNAQLSAFSETDTLRTGRRETRKVLTLQLTRNILTLAIDFLENPDRFNDYYDPSLLPKSSSNDNEDDDATIKVSGRVTIAASGMPIVNARVVLAGGGGAIEVFTGVGGYYTIEVPNPEAPEAGTLSVSATGFMSASSPVTINPDEDHNEDFGLHPAPPTP